MRRVPAGNVALVRAETALGEREDDELMLMARGGVAEAFDVLVRRHQRSALGIARMELGSVDLAKDAAQNAFVQLYRFLPRYEPRGKFKAFLHRVLLNNCRMLRRSAGRGSRFELDVEEMELADAEAPPDDELARRERWRRVERALARLSPKLRMVLTLRFSDGLSYEEIADVAGVSVGTVKSRLFNGIQKLREDFCDEHEDR